MSAEVSGWVWRNAPVKSGELVVLLALADNAHDDGTGAFPSQAHLAKKSRMSDRQVRNCLSALEEKGLIRRSGETRGGVIVWAVLMGAEDISARKPVAGDPGSGLPTEPSREPSSSSLVRGRAVSYQGRRVPAATVDAAETLLAVFNEAEGRELGAWTGAGKPSPGLKQIIGALLTRDHVTVPEWERAIRNVSACPPSWVTGRLELGDVFGERAAERALSNDGVRRENGKKRAGPGMADFAQIALGDG